MIITHKLAWDKCLSHQIWPAIEKGWKDEDKPIHFFWGLGGKNIPEIRQCIENKEEYWFVDVGYLTQQITRYPEPIIHDYDKTYFRICKGGIHTNRGSVGPGVRLQKLESQGIDVEFKGWDTGDEKRNHILICPSSETVTYHMYGLTQQQWIDKVIKELKEYTTKEIVVRNKPRPGNQWWNTDIKDDLKECHCLVTNMSLSAIDAILNKTPVLCDGRNICGPVSSKHPKYIEKPFRPGRKTINEWLKFVSENQFTIKEIEDGTAYDTLNTQNA